MTTSGVFEASGTGTLEIEAGMPKTFTLKLRQPVVGVPPGARLLLQARSIATGALLWEAPEWFLARAANVVLSQESREGDFTLQARRCADGAPLWKREPSRQKSMPDTILIGALGSAFVFADGLRRRQAEVRRDEALGAALAEANTTETDEAFQMHADLLERAHPLTEAMT